MSTQSFFDTADSAFARNLKSRVNTYFASRDLSKNANYEMALKTAMALSLYLIPFALVVWLAPANLAILFALWIVMGFGKAFIGTSVMHDSIHKSYSKKKYVNQIMSVSAWLVGIDPTIWKIQHNVLHHSYTNIEGSDEDIEPRYVLRFSPNQPKRWFHRYQHIYAIFFYAISTLIWVIVKDFIKAFQYKKKGLLKSKPLFSLYLIEIVLRKLSYLGIFLIIPIYVLPVSAGIVILLFITMHITSGTLLSLIFQPAHVIETSDFYDPENHDDKNNWLVHQLKTTSNFGMKSKLLSWFSGCLNHQIEHHLFPNICHVHYPRISTIVRETVAEFKLPYHSQKTMGMAIVQHFSMLKALGRN